MPSAFAEEAPLAAFENFVISGDLKSAHFYLENKLLKPESIETSRLFGLALITSNSVQSSSAPFTIKHMQSVDLLYNYLGAIQEIDLNGLFPCNRLGSEVNNEYVCTLPSFLLSIDAPPAVFDYFLKKGMKLTAFSSDTLPPVVVFASKLGVTYGMQELNWFAGHGMPLGPETYTKAQLKDWGGLIHAGYSIRLPEDKPDTNPFNFIDVLSLSLVNSDYRRVDLNKHRDFLCRYIAHVAAQQAPTFDHFSYLLMNVPEFRAARIGQASHPEQWSPAQREVFPHSCRLLLEAMGRSSTQLGAMINHFSAEADLQTAQWLISLK